MLNMMTAMALAAAAQTAPAATPQANPHTQMPMGQMNMPMGQMDHSKMMNMAHQADGCCKQTADGKMECAMPGKAGSASPHQGHSGR